MKRWVVTLLTIVCVSAYAQKPVRICGTYTEDYAERQLYELLKQGGCSVVRGGKDTGHTIYVGLTPEDSQRYKSTLDSLEADGYAIVGDGRSVHLFGKGGKGTLYAVYAYLEQLGYRLYTPDAMVVPDLRNAPDRSLFTFHLIENPAFAHREVLYYFPNHSQLYADWHHLHTAADRQRSWGMFVHTFSRLLPPDRFFDAHPEWYSLNGGRRMRDGQLCLSNPQVLEALCQRLADTIACQPEATIWSVSPNDNYNACQCPQCLHMDSLFGGPTGTLLTFVNQVARRFPDKTIATLAYQYTRAASHVRPDSNVLVMLCPIEAGRQAPIMQTDPAFHKDIEDWAHLLTTNHSPLTTPHSPLFLWDYVVQFRNFWNPFPNLHVLQSNLQYFNQHGVTMMFEQATGADNITSWMDIRCYMIAKLLWNPYLNVDSLIADFYQGYYGEAGRYVKEIIDTMTAALVASGQTLNIYGFPSDAAGGYLQPRLMHLYDSLMEQAFAIADSAVAERLRLFQLPLDYARADLAAGTDLLAYTGQADTLAAMQWLRRSADTVADRLNRAGVPQMMEMGISPDAWRQTITHLVDKQMPGNKARGSKVTLRRAPTAPYVHDGPQTLTDGRAGILDYRNNWLGLWGDTLDAIIDFGEPTRINSVSIDFYFYPLSWIFLPRIVYCVWSNDGEYWHPLDGSFFPQNPEVLATPKTETYTFTPHWPPLVRYLRLLAMPLEEIPSWHRAAGQKPWIFTDEIIVK